VRRCPYSDYMHRLRSFSKNESDPMIDEIIDGLVRLSE
jgi:hypothetical protein